MALIAFDADGPLFDFAGGVCRALQARGHQFQPFQLHHWDLKKALPESMHEASSAILESAGFCLSLEWMPGARELVGQLRADGHECICVTSPHHSRFWMHERRERLRELFEDDDILFVKGPRKALVAAHVLVEDHPGNAVAWCQNNESRAGVALLVDRPWNGVRSTEWAAHPGMVRVTDGDIRTWIRAL